MKKSFLTIITLSIVLIGISACTNSTKSESTDSNQVYTLIEANYDTDYHQYNLKLKDQNGDIIEAGYFGDDADVAHIGLPVHVKINELVENWVESIYIDGKSIKNDLGKSFEEEIPDDWKTITGTLNATEVSEGNDLPGSFSVISGNDTIVFTDYVNENVVANSGKKVTVHYTVHVSHEVEEIKLAE